MTTETTRNESVKVQVIDVNELLCEQQKKSTTITGVFKNVFHYAAFCEANFKSNIEASGADIIDTTFTNDLSIAEYCEQMHVDDAGTTQAVEDTIQRACKVWKCDENYLIALLFAVNMKAWEHHALLSDKYEKVRAFTKETHEEYARYYSDRYYTLLDYIMDDLMKDREDLRIKIFQAID